MILLITLLTNVWTILNNINSHANLTNLIQMCNKNIKANIKYEQMKWLIKY